MRPPLISIPLLTYNHERYIAESIRSALDQTFADFELIVVDDGSTDRTAEVVASFHDPRIRYVWRENGGPSVATNHGISLCRGRYLALMTGDDLSVPTRLQTQLDAYALGEPRILFSGCDLIDDDGRPIQNSFAESLFETAPLTRAQAYHRFFTRGNFINAVSTFTETALMRSLGPYDPSLYLLQDFELWIRAVKRCSLEVLPQRLIRYRIRNDGGNLSAPSLQSHVWHDNELRLVIRQFFNQCPDDLFRQAFCHELQRPDLESPLASRCEQALLCLKSSRFGYHETGIEKLRELFQDPAAAEMLTRDFSFSLRRLVETIRRLDPLGRLRNHATTLFFDSGSGFRVEESIEIPLTHDSRAGLRFDLPEGTTVQGLRWDPVEFRLCGVTIRRVSWVDGAGEHHELDLNLVTANGHGLAPGRFEFDTIDPMVFLPISGSVRSVTIDGHWQIHDAEASLCRTYDLMMHFQVSLQQAESKVQRLEAELEEMRRGGVEHGHGPHLPHLVLSESH